MRRMSGGNSGNGEGGMGGPMGVFNVGKSRARLIDKEDAKVTFADVAGQESAKQEVQEIVDFLKNPAKYTDLGGKIPKVLCSWALRARARRCWQRPWPAKLTCRSSP